ncbi:DUF3995 domain-containing protein [Corynebacterium hylobatis]|uniref:DUF3995 domain-containing protein n=1 Tax=Corynebacterium hylobatis TaxID=1859290 RepID=A0A3S0HGG8_9CORY|nr:DUF3995 domain-containing protein [Corynebacterium hylobatis]RSZ62360.1 DUF3995 domain-containing protein [Corynebacterium hylobatis]
MTSHPAFLVAAVAGLLHGAASIYWGLGGTWLLETVGEQVTDQFEGLGCLGWAIVTVGAVRIAFALSPLLFDDRWWRILHWLGATALMLWGGANTLVINLVLAGVLPHGDDYDHAAMTGHGWLWDPLFLLWGVALAVGLSATRRGRNPHRL